MQQFALRWSTIEVLGARLSEDLVRMLGDLDINFVVPTDTGFVV